MESNTQHGAQDLKLQEGSFTDFFIKRPVFSWVINIIVMLLGFTAFFQLATRQFPRVDSTEVSVEVTTADMAVNVMERQITVPLEEAFSSLKGLKTLSSRTHKGKVEIDLAFTGRSMDAAAADTQEILHREREKINQRMQINNLETLVSKGSGSSSNRVMELAITSESASLSDLLYIGEKVLKSALESINGVAAVKVFGGSEYKMRVSIDPIKMANHGTTPEDIKQALQKHNFQVSTGYLKEPEKEITITAQSNLKSPRDFDGIVISYQNNRFVRLSDVATVRLRAGEESEKVFYKNRHAIGLEVMGQSDANPITIAKEVRKRIAEVQKTLAKDTQIHAPIDRSVVIKESIDQVYQALIEAVILVLLVIFFFLRSFRASLIPLLTIPVSIVGTFALMSVLGFTINVLSLLAMVLAIGLVVDDAIVVLENIYRYLERGYKPFQAAILGAREIRFSVIAMTLTLVAVYAPIAIIPGTVGKIFREFALTLAGAVLLSGFVALTLSPVMCAHLLKSHHGPKGAASLMAQGSFLGGQPPVASGYAGTLARKFSGAWFFRSFWSTLKGVYAPLGYALRQVKQKPWVEKMLAFSRALSQWIDKSLNALDIFYVKSAKLAIFHKNWVLSAALLFSLACGAWGWFGMRKETSPPVDEGMIQAYFLKGPNRNMRYMLKRTQGAQKIIDKFPQIGKGLLIVSSNDTSYFYGPLRHWNERAETCEEIAKKLGEALEGVRGLQSGAGCPTASMLSGKGEEFPLSFLLCTNRDNSELMKTGRRLKNMLQSIPGVESVDRREVVQVPEYNISIIPDRVNQLRVNPLDVAETLQLMFGRGIIVGTFKRGGEHCNVVMEMDDAFRASLDALGSFYIRGRDDRDNPKSVPLSELTEFKLSMSDASIYHYGKKRSYDIQASVKPGYGLANIYNAFLAKALPQLSEGYEVVPSGELRVYFEEQTSIILIFALALAFIFLIMAAQFESLKDPFIIILSVPLALGGAIFSLIFLPQGSLNIYSQIGLVTLVGLITKHGILMVDFANQYRQEGGSTTEAILKACQLRLRPILMTTLAMVLGAVPLLLATGAGSEARAQIGCVIVGGMMIGTLFTLFVIPIVYLVMKGAGEKTTLISS